MCVSNVQIDAKSFTSAPPVAAVPEDVSTQQEGSQEGVTNDLRGPQKSPRKVRTPRSISLPE